MEYIILKNPVADWLVALVVVAAVAAGLDAFKSILARRLALLSARTDAKWDDIAVAALRSTNQRLRVDVTLRIGRDGDVAGRVRGTAPSSTETA